MKDTMEEQFPAPVVPIMPTAETEDADRSNVSTDGGEHRTIPPQHTDAPIVPDCS